MRALDNVRLLLKPIHASHSEEQYQITSAIILGDSLSDYGAMNNRNLWDIIPMSVLSGLYQHSPNGQFTNGCTWNVHLSQMIFNELLIDEFKQKKFINAGIQSTFDPTDAVEDIITHRWQSGTWAKRNKLHQLRPLSSLRQSHAQCSGVGLDEADISDAVISQDRHIAPLVHNSYALDAKGYVKFKGIDVIRHYTEGGLTANSYARECDTNNFALIITRTILSTLAEMRAKLIEYDQAQNVSQNHKAQTLVIEWSGVNDLITANESPTTDIALKAISARYLNVQELIKQGYRHFILFNLPNLAYTPRFQNMNEKDRLNASFCTHFFNEQLHKRLEYFNAYPKCTVEVFDVNRLFEDVYINPQLYGFDLEKRRQPYTQSAEFAIHRDHTSPAKGYMFWDDVHPTADLHALLAEYFYKNYQNRFAFCTPQLELHARERYISPQTLHARFISAYERHEKTRFAARSQFFSSNLFMFCNRNKTYKNPYTHYTLEDIIYLALYDKEGSKVREIITKLGWIDKEGKVNISIHALRNAMESARLRHADIAAPMTENYVDSSDRACRAPF